MAKGAKVKRKYTLFTGKQLLWLILPIVIEQIFSTSLGMFDSIMISHIPTDGSNASLAVGNVDYINNLIIQLFSAFATGGAIITSQYLGAQDNANCLMRAGIPCAFFAGSRKSGELAAFISDFAAAARTVKELRRMGELCVKYGTLIISDEIHSDLMLFGNKHIPIASLGGKIAENTITCTSATKTFNLAGMQLCNIFIEDEAVREKLLEAKRGIMPMSQTSVSYEACRLAYDRAEGWLEALLQCPAISSQVREQLYQGLVFL